MISTDRSISGSAQLVKNSPDQKFPARILVVDDSDLLRDTFCDLLESAGYETLQASTGAECLRIVAEVPVDLVLLDVVLPDQSGIDVCRQIKTNEPDSGLLVLNISGMQTSSLNLVEGLEGGADGYLTKPIDARTLLAHVNALMRSKKSEEARKQAIQDAHDQLENKVLQRTAELQASNTFLQQEIADRKRIEGALVAAQENYRSIFENAIEGVFQSTPDGRFVSANPAIARIFGYDSPEELMKERNLEQDHYVDPERRKVFKKLMEQHGFVRDFELQAYRTDGIIIWTSENVRAVRDDSGRLLYYEGMVLDITRRKLSEKERFELLGRLVTAQEDEQRRISRELHDQMGQSLAALLLGLRSITDLADSEEAKGQIVRLETIANRIAEEMHTLTRELRPTALDDFGLDSAISNYTQEWSQQTNIRVDFHANGMLDQRFDSQLETAIYRIVQEALNNVLKHAKAKSVSVILRKTGSNLSLIVEDDGVGFDAEALLKTPVRHRRFGLLGMRERVTLVGGSLNIESTRGVGTTIMVHVDTSRHVLPAE